MTMIKAREIVLALLSLALGAAVAWPHGDPLSLIERVQLAMFVATLPWALRFIWIYATDAWWRTWFGRSLMLLAVAIMLYSLSAVLYRLYGLDYFGRDVLIIVSSSATFVAMLIRTEVLLNVQRTERRDRRGDL